MSKHYIVSQEEITRRDKSKRNGKNQRNTKGLNVGIFILSVKQECKYTCSNFTQHRKIMRFYLQ